MSGLSSFLRKKKEEMQSQEKDWEKIRKEWLENLKQFYDTIKSWLKEELNEGLLEIEDFTVTLNEEYLGRYIAPALIIKALDQIISLKPVGRLIIGARGRVDMESYRGKEIFLFLSPEQGWVLLEERGQKGFSVLTKEIFEEALKGLLE